MQIVRISLSKYVLRYQHGSEYITEKFSKINSTRSKYLHFSSTQEVSNCLSTS